VKKFGTPTFILLLAYKQLQYRCASEMSQILRLISRLEAAESFITSKVLTCDKKPQFQNLLEAKLCVSFGVSLSVVLKGIKPRLFSSGVVTSLT
jgi:hypothetical protein